MAIGERLRAQEAGSIWALPNEALPEQAAQSVAIDPSRVTAPAVPLPSTFANTTP
jgi:hypothetical protein